MVPGWIKFVHVLGVFIYAGGLLTLTRMAAKAVRYESAESRSDSYRDLVRMHKFVDWGGLGMMLLAASTSLSPIPAGKEYMRQGYFHMKMTFIIGIFVCDFLTTKKLFALKGEGPQPSPGAFRILHGAVGLCLIGIFAAIYMIRG